MKVMFLLIVMSVFFWCLSIGIALAFRGAGWTSFDLESFAIGACVALVLMSIFMWVADKIVEN